MQHTHKKIFYKSLRQTDSFGKINQANEIITQMLTDLMMTNLKSARKPGEEYNRKVNLGNELIADLQEVSLSAVGQLKEIAQKRQQILARVERRGAKRQKQSVLREKSNLQAELQNKFFKVRRELSFGPTNQ